MRFAFGHTFIFGISGYHRDGSGVPIKDMFCICNVFFRNGVGFVDKRDLLWVNNRFANKACASVVLQFLKKPAFPVVAIIVFPYGTGYYIVHAKYSNNVRKDICDRAYIVNGFRTASAEAESMA